MKKEIINESESKSFFDRVSTEVVEKILNWLLHDFSEFHASPAYVAGGLQFAAQFGMLQHNEWADIRQTANYIQLALTVDYSNPDTVQQQVLSDIFKHWPSVAAAALKINSSAADNEKS